MKNETFATGTPVVIATGDTGGLDPDISNGSYSDTSVEPGNSYAYRIVTFASGQDAVAIPTAIKYIPDLSSEIGYPGGDPVTAANYNLSTVPVFHIDHTRLYGASVVPSSSYGSDPAVSASSMLVPGSDHGTLRVSPAGGYLMNNHLSRPYPRKQFLTSANDVSLVGVGNASGSSSAYTSVDFNTPMTFADEFTMFFSYHITQSTSGYFYLGSSDSVSGVSYSANDIYRVMDAGDISISNGLFDEGSHVVAVRVLNTNSAANGNGAKWQLFHNGALTYTSPVITDSYHLSGGSKGAAHFTHYRDLLNNNSSIVNFEAMIFSSALSAGDLNSVSHYMGGKSYATVSVIDASDVYSG